MAKAAKSSRSAEAVVCAVVVFQSESELMLSTNIGSVVVDRFRVLIDQLIGDRQSGTQAGKTLSTAAYIYNRESAHRRRRVRAGNKTHLSIIRLPDLPRAFRVVVGQTIPVPTKPDFVDPRGIRTVNPYPPTHLCATVVAVDPPWSSSGRRRIGVGIAKVVLAVDVVPFVQVVIDFSDDIIRNADVVQSDRNVLRDRGTARENSFGRIARSSAGGYSTSC